MSSELRFGTWVAREELAASTTSPTSPSATPIVALTDCVHSPSQPLWEYLCGSPSRLQLDQPDQWQVDASRVCCHQATATELSQSSCLKCQTQPSQAEGTSSQRLDFSSLRWLQLLETTHPFPTFAVVLPKPYSDIDTRLGVEMPHVITMHRATYASKQYNPGPCPMSWRV